MCTDFILPFCGKNPTIISGRTMDFTEGTDFQVCKFPIGNPRTSPAPKGGTGVTMEAKYGFVGIGLSVGSLHCLLDGLNTQGLSVGGLWLSYSNYDGGPVKSADPRGKVQSKDAEYLASFLMIDYLLGLCETVEDVQTELDKVDVWFPEKYQDQEPLHLSIHDASGKSLVVEFLNGQAVYYNNDIGVLANGPTFDWHAVNYNYLYNSLTPKDNDSNKYVQLTRDDPSKPYNVTAGNGYQYEVLAAGMLGLPGDSTSPSRFVRAAKLRDCVPAVQQNDGENGVQSALQVLGRVTVCNKEVLLYFNSKGEACDPMTTYNPTLWASVKNHTDRIYYYYTESNHNLQAVDLNTGTLDFNDGKFCSAPLTSDSWYNNATGNLTG